MIKDQTQNAYTKSVNAVLNYVEKNYSSNLQLEQLASVGNFSPYHFHRIFKAVTGETHQDFINRKRLEKAVHKMEEGFSFTQIAYDTGFASPAHFSHAFKKFYKKTPRDFFSVYKKTGIYPVTEQKTDTAVIYTDIPYTVKQYPEYNIAYVRHIGSYDFRIGIAWKKLMGWARENKLITAESMRISFSHNDPRLCPDNKVMYDACVVIPGDYTVKGDEPVSFRTIHSGPFISAFFEGSPFDLPGFYTALYKKIISQNTLTLFDERDFCIHNESVFDQIRGKFQNEIRIAVKDE